MPWFARYFFMISNMYDILERFIPRIQSRVGPRMIRFAPYTYLELESIMRSRAPDMDPRVVEFASRLVSSVAGDVRKCLELLRRVRDSGAPDSINEVRRQYNAMGADPSISMLRSLSEVEKKVVLLLAKKFESDFGGLTFDHLRRHVTDDHSYQYTEQELWEVVSTLQRTDIVSTLPDRSVRRQVVELKTDSDTVFHALDTSISSSVA